MFWKSLESYLSYFTYVIYIATNFWVFHPESKLNKKSCLYTFPKFAHFLCNYII